MGFTVGAGGDGGSSVRHRRARSAPPQAGQQRKEAAGVRWQARTPARPQGSTGFAVSVPPAVRTPLLPRLGQRRVHRRVHPGGIRADGDRDHGEGEAGRDRAATSSAPWPPAPSTPPWTPRVASASIATLRDFAGLELNTRVVVSGSFDRVEIWNAQAYDDVVARGGAALKGA